MKQLNALACLIVLAGLLFGCSKKPPVIEQISEAELPQTVRDAFASAPEGLKTMANEAAGLFETQKYSQASLVLESLMGAADLTEEQSSIASRAFLTANAKVGEAAESGDAQAEQFRQYRMENK